MRSAIGDVVDDRICSFRRGRDGQGEMNLYERQWEKIELSCSKLVKDWETVDEVRERCLMKWRKQNGKEEEINIYIYNESSRMYLPKVLHLGSNVNIKRRYIVTKLSPGNIHPLDIRCPIAPC
jgi:hypothetical protein